MRQIHETQIEITKVKLGLESITTEFLILSSKEKPEEFRQKAFEHPHPDLFNELQVIKKRLIDILDLGEVPGDKEWKWGNRITISEIEIDPDNGQIRFKYEFKAPAFSKPVTCKTDWSNDFALETYSQFLEEVKMFVTKQKRAQSDMFAGGSPGSSDMEVSEDKQINGRKPALPEHEEEPAEVV